ncbi:PREDICTED: putative F-box/LRR-repeat protein At3g59230 isoform X2 [Camelina sativa]|uniref:F-box/LRR-repeat protein At3g59230 isoform X2 n=1 Tax=Camelina sativa TaxID=90675 RepID=A0ABM1RRQ5_CAMSA|nr:PREDICTED: putative F-box/LRR-repeat protein At3g59230 isoform X2 [Camelina sativa]
MDLEFDDSHFMHPTKTRKQERAELRADFITLVDSMLALQGNDPLNRFSVKCKDDVGSAPVIGWINNVLNLDVSELVLHISSYWDWPLSSEVIVSERMVQEFWQSCSVSSTSLKRLTLLVSFDSLTGASLNLRMTHDQINRAKFSDDDFIKPDEGMVGNATDLIIGISNVKTLYLSDNTLEVMPVFNSLIHLTVETHNNVGWESLPTLLKKCPNLETLVFDGFHHKYTIKCGDVDGCLCKFSGEVPTCLSSSPVKALKVLRFGETGIENQIELIKHFLETMPRLEKLTVHYDTSIDDDLIKVSSQLNNFAREASPNCEIHVISDRLLN